MAWCSRLFVSGKGEGGAKHKNWLPVAHDHSATIRPRIVKIPLTDLTHIGFFSLSDKWHLGWSTLRPAANLGKTAPCSWLAQLQSTLPCRPSLSKWLYLCALGCVSPALTPRNSSPRKSHFCTPASISSSWRSGQRRCKATAVPLVPPSCELHRRVLAVIFVP